MQAVRHINIKSLVVLPCVWFNTSKSKTLIPVNNQVWGKIIFQICDMNFKCLAMNDIAIAVYLFSPFQ
jgi:hypothetical protein